MRQGLLYWVLALGLSTSGCAGPMAARPVVTESPAPAAAPAGPAIPSPTSSKTSADRDADGIPDAQDKCPDQGGGGDGCPSAPASLAAGQKLVYTARLTLAVFQVEAALGKVEGIAREVGGYLSARADREITIRVPRASFDASIRRIEATGDVLHRDIQAQDVTDEYFDLEVRLKNARVMRDRLVQLLAKATVKDAIEIEKELGHVTEEIERFEGRLKLLADKVSFSTITVSLQPVDTSPVAQQAPLPFPWLQELGLAHLLSVRP